MVAKRTSKTRPNLPPRFTEFRLAPRRVLRAGGEAMIRVPGRETLLRARFLYADDRGFLTFVDPRNNGLRTISVDDVDTVCRTSKMRPG